MIEEKYTDMSLTDEQASLLGFKSFSESEQYIQGYPNMLLTSMEKDPTYTQ